MKRGDLVTAVLPGQSGKPRPALIVQADRFAGLPTITVLPLTATLTGAGSLRVVVEPSVSNGLLQPSEVMIDRPQSPPLGKIGQVIGQLDDVSMRRVSDRLAVFLGLA